MISISVRTQFDKTKLKKKAETASFRSLGHAGGAIRKTAQGSVFVAGKLHPRQAARHTHRPGCSNV